MDPDEFRRLLTSSGADLWALIDVAVGIAAREHGAELRARRDAIVERLYAIPVPEPTARTTPDRFRDCGLDGEVLRPPSRRRGEEEKGSSASPERRGATTPSPPELVNRDEAEEIEKEEEEDLRGGGRPACDEKSKILAIKELLEDPAQSEDTLASLLQNLADMNITFGALKESDIGRHVNGLRKHPSNEVRRLVKQLVRKWKDIVDEWVKSNSAGETSSPAIVTDGDSPRQFSSKNNGHNQVLEFGYSPNPRLDGYFSSDRSGSESVAEPPKARAGAAAASNAPPRREAPPTKPNNINHSNRQPIPSSATPSQKANNQKDVMMEDRLASARKRLQENYQEADNAKRQRTIQVMDIHEIPKPKGSSVRRGGFQAKHW